MATLTTDGAVDFGRTEGVRGRVQSRFTIKAFRTLEFLIKNVRRAISRDDLSNKVWGNPRTHTADNHILRLRQQLETDPSSPAHLVANMVSATSSCLRARLRT